MQYVTKDQLHEIINKKQSFILDVRELEEYEQGHIHTAILAPWHTVTQRIAGLKPTTTLVLYCRTNSRAHKAAKLLEDNGFTNVRIYSGGWEEWSST